MNNYDYYLVTRPLFSKFERENGMPVIRKSNKQKLDDVSFLNFSNINKIKENSLILMFHHDKKLETLWNNPLKYVSCFKKCFGVITPDFTIQSNMDEEMIRMNIYKNRWLGCTWQQYGVNVIPSISWADSKTYDLCFSGFENNSIVAISTIGCKKADERKIFLDGYNELVKRKNPSIVICFGGIIKGMHGKILPVNYDDSFSPNCKVQYLPLFKLSNILELKGDADYGW